ncbi:MAG TPA: alpha/beta hydrolase, partial [Candidatus Nanopelagicaceae bacterium]|nr:alpha/beta hydrolase [Candidatus Nanopelagicaceae bacterium]
EKRVLIPNAERSDLHGVLYFALEENALDRPPILIMCHGFTGDKYEWGRFPETAKALNKEEYDVLIFDFSGSGENKREPINVTKQANDLEGVCNWVKNQGYSKIAVLGLSFGGQTLLKASLSGIITYIFWAPFFLLHTTEDHADWFKDIAKGPVEIPTSGDYEPIIIDMSFMTEVAKFRVRTALKKLNLPTLIIQGTLDESVPLELTKKAFNLMPQDENHKLVEVQDATHDFVEEHLEIFIRETVNWLKKYF